MFEREGMRGLFRGNYASVVRVAPYAAIQFATFERAKSAVVTLGLDAKSPVTNLMGAWRACVHACARRRRASLILRGGRVRAQSAASRAA